MLKSRKKYTWDCPTCIFWLKVVLAIYIVLCFLLAGLNFGYAKQASPEIARFIEWFWHFYENWIKTAFILIASWLTYRIIQQSGSSRMRKNNLIGFSITALLLHILLPLLLHNPELYLFSMPLPWNSGPLQLMQAKSASYSRYLLSWSSLGIRIVLIYHLVLSLIILIGTLLLGRRWQCSTVCMFNGFASEVFSPAIPLFGKRKRFRRNDKIAFNWARWLAFSLALFFVGYWGWTFFRPDQANTSFANLLRQLEVYKYLIFELTLMMVFWMVFVGRTYCAYCPLGTFLSLISRWSQQSIRTELTKCIQCGKCNQACPMGIDIQSRAGKQLPVTDLTCVGCGHCVDACPANTLQYTTHFLRLTQKNTIGTVPLVRKLSDERRS